MTISHLRAICLVLGLAGCSAPRALETPPPKAVRVAAAQPMQPPRGLRYAVTMEPAERLILAVKGNGYVAGLHQVRGADGRLRNLQPGDTIRAGTILARLRDAEYIERLHQAEGSLQEAEASLSKAQRDLDRARTLFAAESLTRPDLDAAQAAADAGQARMTTAHANVEAARLALADCTLAAPIAGVVLERRIETGMLATAGTVAFVLGRVAEVKAMFGVADSVVSRLALGQPLTMSTEAFPGAAFNGRVTAIAPAAEPQSRAFAIEVTLPNGDGRLKPGMIGAIELSAPAQTAGAAMAVPLAAIVSADQPNRYAVYVVQSSGTGDVARSRLVTLGATVGNAVTVTDGLATGERVVVMGATLVRDGEPVRVIP